MNAVVLAGGLRSGLEVPGSGVPRALWPFPSKPLVAHVLEFLHNAGAARIAICANGKTRMIASQLSSASEPWNNLHYSEDPLPRGPAGCLRDLQDWLGDDTFIAIQGTAHYDFDLQAMIDEHRRTGAAVTVGARVCSDDQNLLEPIGVYLVEPRTLPLIQSVGYQDFKEQFLPKVIDSGMNVRSHTIRGTATLIHSPQHYLSSLRDAIHRAAAALPPGFSEQSPGIYVHESAEIHPSARLSGTVWVDANARIDEHAILAGPVVVGPGARVKGHALLHRTVAMRNSTIGTAAEVFSTILPPGTIHSARPTRRPNPGETAPRTEASGRRFSPIRDRVERVLSVFGSPRSAVE